MIRLTVVRIKLVGCLACKEMKYGEMGTLLTWAVSRMKRRMWRESGRRIRGRVEEMKKISRSREKKKLFSEVPMGYYESYKDND